MPKKSSQYIRLRSKWLKRHKKIRTDLETKHKEALDWISDAIPAKEKIASGAIGALMLSNTLPGVVSASNVNVEPIKKENVQKVDKTEQMRSQLLLMLPREMRSLTPSEEEIVGHIISSNLGISAKAEIDGKRLNRTYGLIGAEQHLVRFPGDGMGGHLSGDVERNGSIFSSGMAPGRGAWGYFASSGATLDQKAVEREKWYIAVQTFLAPDYTKRLSDYRDWFKYRKMVVVNPRTGQSVVVDIADAGPAQWTGKHLGGSPEVMQALGLHTGPRKGAVLYFFLDDPNDTIPLGPIKGAS